MTRIAIAVAALVAAAVMALPAAAITDGELDGNGHPYVGLMVAQTADGTPLWRCSGTLLSETVYLTAGHCTEEPAAHVEIFFSAGPVNNDPNYTSIAAGGTGCANVAVTGYPCHGDVGGTPYTHPEFYDGPFFLHDVGVVVLDDEFASPNDVYGVLPSENALDALKPRRSTTLTAVGYGLQKSFPDAAGWKDEAQRTRMVARPHLLQVNRGIVGDFSLLLSNNANTGGTCFGDSGGPNFLGDSNVVAGITSFGLNSTCGGTGGVFRTDRANVLDFINEFMNDEASGAAAGTAAASSPQNAGGAAAPTTERGAGKNPEKGKKLGLAKR